LIHHTQHDTKPRRNGINQEEHIVFLKETGLNLMVVFMEVPHQAVHHVFMCGPSHEFHDKKRTE
jgi:hypothetical protein